MIYLRWVVVSFRRRRRRRIYLFAISHPHPLILAQNDTQDPHPLPEPASGESLLQNALSQFDWILTDATLEQDKCATCISVLNVAQFLSLAAPEQGPAFFVFLCQELELLFVCEKEFSATTYGSVLTQIFAKANVRGYDGQVRMGRLWFCHVVDSPRVVPDDLTD
jgi:sphingomyelin phosphodiesterase